MNTLDSTLKELVEQSSRNEQIINNYKDLFDNYVKLID